MLWSCKFPLASLRFLYISALGDGMRHAALPLLASSTLDSAIGISGITVATTLPWLLFSLPIGVYVDRYSKINLMIMADIFRGVAAMIAVILFCIDHANITVLVFLAFSISVGSVLFECASESFIPFVMRSARPMAASQRQRQ
ncbi:MFS transporter [Sinorhizobium medicae]